MKVIRVMHVLDHSLPLQSGYALRTEKLLQTERALGIEPLALTSPSQGRTASACDEIGGLRYYRTPELAAGRIPRRIFLREALFVERLARRTAALAQAERVDIIHAHSPSIVGSAALRAARRLGLPCVYQSRTSWEDAGVSKGTLREGSVRYRLSRWFEMRLLRRVDRVITISEGLRREYELRGLASSAILVVPNGVDPDVFAPRPPSGEILRRHALGGALVLGYAGSFNRYEGLDLLLRAVAQLAPSRPDVRVLLVGGGEDDARLRHLAQELGLSRRVVFSGRVPHQEVIDHLSVIDVFVYPRIPLRITELVTALKPLEAMAMGKLVIASDVGGNRELIQDGVTGRLFAAGSIEGLVAAIEHAADPAVRNEFGRRAREAVLRRRVWPELVSPCVTLYRSLLDGSHGSAAAPGD